MKFGEDTYAQYLGQVIDYSDGEIVFEEGTAGGWVYVIAYGQIEIVKTVNGREVTLDRLYEGEVIGEVSFFDGHTRSAGARAVGDTGLMQFDERFLRQEYKKLPNCYKVIMEAMALRLRRLAHKTTVLATNPQILKMLAKEAARTPED